MPYHPRPESAKGSVHAKFIAEGEAAALEFALALTTRKLNEKQVRRWFKKWGGATTTTPIDDEPTVESAPEPTTKSGKNRVYSINDLKMTGTVVVAGPGTSTVKWDDPSPWGGQTNEPNAFLRPCGTHPITANDRAVFLWASHFVVVDMTTPTRHKKGTPKPPVPEQYKTFAKACAAAGKKQSVHAVTSGGNSILLLRSLWPEFDKLVDTYEREET